MLRDYCCLHTATPTLSLRWSAVEMFFYVITQQERKKGKVSAVPNELIRTWYVADLASAATRTLSDGLRPPFQLPPNVKSQQRVKEMLTGP